MTRTQARSLAKTIRQHDPTTSVEVKRADNGYVVIARDFNPQTGNWSRAWLVTGPGHAWKPLEAP